eukprot:TRINITY_DN27878_c0_g1_i1.p3 TRINITY_DN27878_c0_g1~~TRINITY_DN27878_c0_g1_i1.p3  ORF type:complete len:257 (-),score=72.11 TRINITY_DN27878_c0_g1_i1:150-920(-)
MAQDLLGPEHMYFDFLASVVGILMGLFGYRCYRPCLFISGYLVGGAISYHLAAREDEFENAAIAFALGAVCGFFTSNYYSLGVATLGAVWGCTAMLTLNPVLISRVAHAWWGGSNAPLVLCMVGCGLVCAAIAVMAHQHEAGFKAAHPRKLLIFVKTATPGAYLLAKGICALALVEELPELAMASAETIPWGSLLRVGLTVVLAVLFAGVQAKFTHKEHCGVEAQELTHTEDVEEQRHLVTETYASVGSNPKQDRF